jgi:hypothetical protein
MNYPVAKLKFLHWLRSVLYDNEGVAAGFGFEHLNWYQPRVDKAGKLSLV